MTRKTNIRKFCKRLVFFGVLPFAFTVSLLTRKKDLPKDNDNLRKQLDSLCHKKPTTISQKSELNPIYDLSIIVPVYNTANYVTDCLNSIFSQVTHYSFIVIAVDDGSTDDSANKLSDFVNRKNFALISQKNGGLSSARNAGLKEISSNFVCFLDSDDIMMPDFIETMMNVAVAKNADVVQCDYFRFSDQATAQQAGRIKRKNNAFPANPLNDYFGFAWGSIFVSRIFEDLKFPNGYLYEDTIMSMIIFQQLHRFWKLPMKLIGYRINTTGITATYKSGNQNIQSYWLTSFLLTQQKEFSAICPERESFFIRQSFVNLSRLKGLPKTTQKLVFCLLCNDYSIQVYEPKRMPIIYFMGKMALRKNNFTSFKLALFCWSLMQ